MRHVLLAALLAACVSPEPVVGPNAPTGHSVVLVTLDGVRWQELFLGEDPLLVREPKPIFERFWAELAPRGQVYGDPTNGEDVRAATATNASLPAYMSLYAEVAQGCFTNECGRIGVRTLADRLHDELGFAREQVQVIAAWRKLELAVSSRDEVAEVEAGAVNAPGEGHAPERALIAEGYESDRLPVLALREKLPERPRFLHLALWDSDRYGHQGDYARYVNVLRAYDRLLIEISEGLDDQTALVVTTDHGRGIADQWSEHGPQLPASSRVWAFVLPPRAGDFTLEAPRARRFDHHDVRYTIEALFGLGTPGSKGFVASQ
ncbi:MAG: alkaline phosphatase family protein [Myxococcaceae bacterium]|nr:alkaline phosphatase family protein [Myxococcaceae bacterium]